MYLVPNETMRCPILLGRDSWMRFHSRSYRTLPPAPDGRVFGELTLAHINHHSACGASAYIRNCDALEVAYHLTYEGKDMSLDDTPQLLPVNLVRRDGSPALTGDYMVDLLLLSTAWRLLNASSLPTNETSRPRGVESSKRAIS